MKHEFLKVQPAVAVTGIDGDTHSRGVRVLFVRGAVGVAVCAIDFVVKQAKDWPSKVAFVVAPVGSTNPASEGADDVYGKAVNSSGGVRYDAINSVKGFFELTIRGLEPGEYDMYVIAMDE